MARMLDEFEQREQDRQREAEERARKSRKTAFVKRWVSASPEEQAAIIFDIWEGVGAARQSAARANFHHIGF